MAPTEIPDSCLFPIQTLSSAGSRSEEQVPSEVENKVSRHVEHDVSRKARVEVANVPGAVISSAKDAPEAQTSPIMVDLGSILTLLTVLRPRLPRIRVRRQELSLPPGCVLAVRYNSR